MKFLTVFASLLLCVCMLCSFVPTKAETQIFENTLRLHVVASSDDDRDQQIKLAVRDAVLTQAHSIIKDCENAGETERLLSENLDLLCETANKVLSENGFDERCEAIISREYYPTKRYDGLCFPEGVYPSLRMIIGAGKGHNWWCVLYPQLSVGAASSRETIVNAGFSPSQIDVLTGGDRPEYKLKFKILEMFKR